MEPFGTELSVGSYLPLKAPLTTSEIHVFISSSSEDDALVLRRRVSDLVAVINKNLVECGSTLRVVPRFWEDVSPQRFVTDNPIDVFVDMAKSSHHAVALFVKCLRSGTKDEVLAVLEEPDVQLSVLVFPPSGDMGQTDAELREFMDEHRDQFLYKKECGDARSDEAWLALVGTILFALFRYVFKPEGAFYETR